MRDFRPAFAASKDELKSELAKPDWANLLRDRLGLAHYPGPHDVALMEYSAAEVKAAASSWTACPFTAPTVLDSGAWAYFYPSPIGLPCGRAMPLFEVADDSQLLAEILHFRIPYRREHLAALGRIDRPPPACDIRLLRNHHLMAVRIAADDYAFGEEIA
ncbi:MAG: hypothetical protein H7Z12_07930 [Rhodospirillaceae bacterium]|nr:hypothetical protein [Rhodospirillales bacterium]